MSSRLNLNLQQAWWTVFPILLGAWFAVRVVAGVYLYTQPKLYESIAVLDESPAPAVAPGATRTVSPSVAETVALRLDLPSRWKLSESAAAEVVRDRVVIRRSDDGGTTEIVCRHGISIDARDIASHLAEDYRGWQHDAFLARLPATRRHDLLRREPLQEKLETTRQHLRDWDDVAESDELTARAVHHVREGLTPPADDADLRAEINAYRALLQQRDFLQTELSALEKTLGGASLPPEARIAVLQPAEIGVRPVSPDIQLGMLLASVAGVVVGFLSWWLYLARIRTPLTPEQLAARRERAKTRNAADY